MDEKTLETLEFPKVLDQLAQHTSFAVGRELVMGLRPLTDIGDIGRLQRATSEAVQVLEIKADLTLAGARDIRPVIGRAVVGGSVEPLEFLDVAATLERAHKVKDFLLRASQGCDYFDLLRMQAGRIFDGSQLEAEIKRCINDRGDVVDAASPELRQIRLSVRQAHDDLLGRLQAILNSSQHQKALQEHVITTRNGRYVVPVKADFKGQIRGIVHDQSASGATLFVEPLATVELNNRWRQLQLAEEKEVERILRRLATMIAAHRQELEETVSALGQIDLALAKARYSNKMRAVEPEIAGGEEEPERVLELVDARHPLLTGGVVPITVRLGGDYRALVVTGPNTGGKTVALKTAGLLALMAQSGLHIPAAEGSKTPLFTQVFADIGDEQSIEQSLSTFSSHMSHIVDMLRSVDGRSLVLLDEIGAGTDPAEGSALARAVLSFLVEKGALTIATTHYSALKTYAHSTPGVENASVEFDPETLAPTYRLTIGLPGRSNALAIASRLGLSAEVVEDARQMLDPSEVRIDDLLAQIQEEREAARKLREETERSARRAAQLNRDLERRLYELEVGKREAIEEVRAQAIDRIEELQGRLARLEAEAGRVAATREWLAGAREEARGVEKEIETAIPKPVRPKAPLQSRGPLKVGDTVLVSSLGMEGEILRLLEGGQAAEVQLGSFKTKVDLDDVRRVRRARPRRSDININVSVDTVPSIECDLRGRRAEEIGPILDRYLNDAYLSGMHQIRIIHGKGTGVLRQVVRDLLEGHALVAGYEPASASTGGEGATVVNLVSRTEVTANGRRAS